MRSSLFRACVVLVVLLLSQFAFATSYQITDVGAFDDLWITGSNNLGQVVGVIDSHTGFLWSPGIGFTYLPCIEGFDSSIPEAVNSNGQIVGYSMYSGGSSRACLWEQGKPVLDLDPHPTGQYRPTSTANGINESGQVVGRSTLGTPYMHGFLRSPDGDMENITGDSQSYEPLAVNDKGVVLGQHGSLPFLWDRTNGLRDLELPVYANWPIGINNSGRVVLASVYGWGYGDAYVWDEETGYQILGSLPGKHQWAAPEDMNNSGQVVGRSSDQPFVWDDTNGIQPLPKLPDHGYVIASAINDSGQIAGSSLDSSGDWHLVLWTPVPEPSSLLAMLGGVGCLIGLRKRRRIA